MKYDKLIFVDDFLLPVISQWKRPQLILSHIHSELTPYFMK